MPQIAKKLADVPVARAGFESIGITAPIMMQMNPSGKWESEQPESLDEEQLKKVVKYLVKSNAVNIVQSYCSQCAAENKNAGGAGSKPNYVPVIMMPVYSPDDCPFDMTSEANKLEGEQKPKKGKIHTVRTENKEEAVTRGLKKRVFQLQRLTDFDLLSQW